MMPKGDLSVLCQTITADTVSVTAHWTKPLKTPLLLKQHHHPKHYEGDCENLG